MCLQVNTENNGIIEFTIIEGTFIDGVRLAEGVKVKVESEVYSDLDYYPAISIKAG